MRHNLLQDNRLCGFMMPGNRCAVSAPRVRVRGRPGKEGGMYRKILIPLDGSTLAESVVPKVLRFLEVTAPEVILFRAIPDVGLPRLDQNLIISKLTEGAEEYLGEVRERLEDQGVSCRTLTRRGEPAEAILAACGEEGADLIAMSTHGRSGVGRWFFGSVAQKVSSHSDVPLLLLRAEEEPPRDWKEIEAGPYDKILLPLDGSALAEEAIPHASEIARAFDGEVILFRVVTIPPLPGLEAAPLIETALTDADEYLRGVTPKLQGRGTALVEQGIPADAILGAAEKRDVDLIVMTTHGRSGLSRFLMGSVADRVVQGSGRPVLMIRSSPEP